MKKEEVISQVKNSLGSLFTKDDVINCLNMVVEEQPKVEESKQDFIAILNLIKDKVRETINDFDFDDSSSIAIDNVEFEIRYGNQIEIDSFSVDARELKTGLLYNIQSAFEDLQEEHETRMEIIAEQKEAVEQN
jgi:hypothetical protein